jgi:pimeloyl-ACP methyl ester carboxylesterase
VANQHDGAVLLVGHGYGGAVIANAAGANNVTGLVFIAALAPDAGERFAELLSRFPETPLGAALAPESYPNGHDTDAIEFLLAPAQFPAVFANDLPEGDAQTLAALQRPIALAALEEPSGAPLWRSVPAWYLVCRDDRVLHPDAQRFFARRSQARTTEIDASHAAPVSRANDVARMILDALRRGAPPNGAERA